MRTPATSWTRRRICGSLATGLTLFSAHDWVIANAPSTPPSLPPDVPTDLRLAGEGTLRVLGLRIYDARLWVDPHFTADRFEQFSALLELHYHRGFSARQIAARSLIEIRRQREVDTELAEKWLADLVRLIPDVQAGERLLGYYQPELGMRLRHGALDRGEITDLELARRFLGIWLSTKTSEPALRKALTSRLPKPLP